ncbi:hypothetical protein HAV15_004870 [Penicillium sp. str. |nr:hypothetical protein HAV15_004870 [Penicillium sp. str. \
MLDFIDYVSSTLNRFLAFDPALGVVLYEQLGDVTRYRMAIERQDRKHWARISRYWYQKAADRNPNIGRIQHSLAVLSHSDVLQKLFYLTKAFVSVQPYPPGHGQATIDIFFDHWKNLPFQHDMAAHFVIVHSALLVNDSGDRFKTSANIFMSLLPRHVQRPRSLNQHEVYIMSCNIASILGYGTPEYQHMADHFSKQNSGAAASESTSVQKKADAIFLTFGTLSVLLRHSKFPNVVPGIHISLAFLWRVSFHRSVMEMLEVAVPWQAVTAFLNSLFSHDTAFSKIEDQNFPVGDYGTAAQLPEDLLIRGQVWSKFYYPESFLKDASGYGISLDELDQEEVVRKNRCLWLGVQIAKNSLTGSTEIAVVIGISTCASTACPPAGEVMGTILYHGGFDPQYHEASQLPYQNFTVTVPTLITAGNGQINIANVVLVGVSIL